MGTFLVFILKSTFCLAGFYLFYRLLLSRDTFHRFNRIALLGVIVFSVIIPFIRLATGSAAAIQRPVQNLEYLLLTAQTQVEAELEPTDLSLWLTVLFFIYIGGCLFFTVRFLFAFGQIVVLINSGEKILLENGIRLVITDKTVCPFSWMRFIVISRVDMEENGTEILVHEKAHIEARHSYDMLLAGLCAIIHWFNPASWLLKQELQNIHEYEADEQVIRHGIDEKHYQLLLIKKAVGTQRFTSMANSFNHSKLKKRITMMLKQKSSPYARLKYLYVLPLTAIAVAAFARPEVSRELEKISNAKVIETPVIPQISPVKKVTEKEFPRSKTVPDTIQVRQSAKPEPAKPIAGEPDPGKTENLKGTVTNIYKLGADVLYIVDGVEVTEDEKNRLDPLKIKSVVVLKDASAEKIYGEKGKNGVIIIVTHNPGDQNQSEVTAGSAKKYGYTFKKLDLDEPRNSSTIRGLKSNESPFIIVDGKEISNEEFDNLDQGQINSISILKDGSAVEKYGEKAKNKGVIEIELKEK